MDDIDRYEQDRAFLETLKKEEPKPEAKATGFCLNCGTPLNDGRRWCDAECMEEWQEYQKKVAWSNKNRGK